MKNPIKLLSSGLLLASLFSFGLTQSIAQDTVLVNFTGAPTQFTVPPGYTCDIEIIIAGGSGGDNLAQNYAGYLGGEGAVITQIIQVNPGDVWDINVGGQGSQGNASGGYNGGGSGCSASGNYSSGGGGGATVVDINGTPTYIAGAGGGSGGGQMVWKQLKEMYLLLPKGFCLLIMVRTQRWTILNLLNLPINL